MSMRRRSPVVLGLVVLTLLSSALAAPAAPAGTPRLQLRAASSFVEIPRYGRGPVWLELGKNPGLAPGLVAAAQVRFGPGLALPVVADPDSVVALAGVDPAPLSVRLALLGDRVNVAGARP